MKAWEKTYENGQQSNNVEFPEQFLTKIFFDPIFSDQFYTKHSKKILDLGCGYGRNIPLFQKFSNEIYCSDPSEQALSYVQQKWEVEVSRIRPPKLKFDFQFDLIVACNSIYYLGPNFTFDEYFKNILSNLKADGLLIASFIGKKHSILKGGRYSSKNIFTLGQSKNLKFMDREGQHIFLPDSERCFEKFGLEKLIHGEIKDTWDGVLRHLNVFLFKKK